MKKFLLGMTAAIGLAAPAIAADMPLKAPAPPPPPVHTWTGCYVGAGGGYGMYHQTFRPETIPGLVRLYEDGDSGGRGWFGTVQVGCDYQFGNFLVGAFGDYDWSNINGNFLEPIFGTFSSVGREKLSRSWAAGGRIGYLPSPNLLVFVSGGWSQARFDRINLRDSIVGGVGDLGLNVPAHTYNGGFLGTGYEYQLGWIPNVTWKTEYRYYSYGSDNVCVVVTATGACSGAGFSFNKYVQTIRSELVWRFNFGGPVIARY